MTRGASKWRTASPLAALIVLAFVASSAAALCTEDAPIAPTPDARSVTFLSVMPLSRYRKTRVYKRTGRVAIVQENRITYIDAARLSAMPDATFVAIDERENFADGTFVVVAEIL